MVIAERAVSNKDDICEVQTMLHETLVGLTN